MTELEVPQAALDALYRRDHPRPSDEDYIRPIATPVVVAYLRKLASRTREMPSDAGLLREFLLREADEIDREEQQS